MMAPQGYTVEVPEVMATSPASAPLPMTPTSYTCLPAHGHMLVCQLVYIAQGRSPASGASCMAIGKAGLPCLDHHKKVLWHLIVSFTLLSNTSGSTG